MLTRCLFLSTALLLGAAPASACPVCHTATGEQVRRGIFNDEILQNAAEIAAPFPLFAVAVLGVRAALRPRPRKL
jgi:hypothetical protein